MKLGTYDLQELIGTGGMGSVFRAVQRDTQQVVAIKVMKDDSLEDPVLFRRFELEYAVASRLEHPHIVRALEFGIEGSQPFLVMELVEGHSLGQVVRNNGPLGEVEAFRVIREVASALQYAHDNRLIHRDVKPDNILLTASGLAKLADLGLVKDLDGMALTQPRSSLGTISYMAPEQFEGADRVDPRCDVYGLAGTLYFALTGVVPFPGRGNMTVLQKKLRNELVFPSQLLESLRPEMDALIARALDVSPERRPRSCAEFASGLVPGTSSNSGRERRIARRFPSLLTARCLSLDGRPRGVGEILDVSRTGLCLLLDCAIQNGEALRVEVTDDKTNQTYSWLFQTCWVRPVAPSSSRLGGVFERELTAEEMDLLLGSLPHTNQIR